MEKTAVHRRVEQLYRDHKDHVYNYITRLTRDQGLASDITQQTFMKLLTDPNIENLATPKAYIFTVARNTLYDEWRRKKERLLHEGEESMVEAMPDDPLEAPVVIVEQQDMQDKVEQAISIMRPKFRELMLLRYTEDLSLEEIAKVTGRSVNDVKVNLHRARLTFDRDFTYLMYARVAKSRERCDTIGELLIPYQDRELPKDYLQSIAKHLDGCAVCAKDMEEMKRDRKLFTVLPLIPTPVALDTFIIPTDLTEQVISATSSSSATVSTTGVSVVKGMISKGLLTKLVASVAVVGVITTGGYLLQRQPSSVVKTPQAELVTPDSTGATGAVQSTPDLIPQINGQEKAQEKQTGNIKPKEAKHKGTYYDGDPFVADTSDYDTSDTEGRETGKLYMSAAGARSEHRLANGQTIVMIANFPRKQVWLLNPALKQYVEDAFDEQGNAKGELKQIMHNYNTESGVTTQGTGYEQPCEDYARKQKIGEEFILGRATEKWHCSSKNGNAVLTEWFDPKIKFIIRSESGGHIQELYNIRFSAQPDNLFQLPKGYTRVKLSQLYSKPTLTSGK